MRKKEIVVQNKEIYVLHFSEKVRVNILGILMRKTYVSVMKPLILNKVVSNQRKTMWV